MNDALSIPAEYLALANAQDATEVAFGAGQALALARAGSVEQAPEWVQVFPPGPTIKARDGREWTLPDPVPVIAAFRANQADLPVDVEHASELKAPKGEPAPAQGWVSELAVRDGVLCARVAWTADGAVAVTSRAYRYISPAFSFNAAGQITALRSLALVTQPALTMPALARDGGRPSPQQDPSMTQSLIVRLAAAFGLPQTATEDQLVQAAADQVALASATRDPAKFVPAADLQAALARATTAETALAARETADKEAVALAAVEKAIADGKLTPATKDHWLAIASSNPDAFNAAIASMPSIKGVTDAGKDPNKKGETGAEGLDAEQLALCRQLSIDPVEFAKTLAEEGAAQ